MNVLFDLDGVFTSGNFFYDKSGKTLKEFGAHDSDGIKILKNFNFIVSVITADERGFDISKKRMEDLNLKLDLVKEKDRFNWVKNNYNFNDLIYVADGLWDIKILKKSAYSICTNNALDIVKKNSNFITKPNGANGAVFEACYEIAMRFKKKDFQNFLVQEVGLNEADI